MSKIGEELAKQAKKNGICKIWYHDLKKTTDTDKLLDMYIRGIDFCLEKNYPSNDYIRKNFVGKMEAFGVHLDENIRIINEKKVVALGNCVGTVETSGFATSEVFIKHESVLLITASDHSFIMIDLFDQAELSVIANDDAKVCVNYYGGILKTDQKANGIVKIIQKNKKTY